MDIPNDQQIETDNGGLRVPISGILYLLHPCEFKLTQFPVYKIGRTQNIKKRKIQYGGITELLCYSAVENMFSMEKKLINAFKIRFIQQTEIGHEYFRGDPEHMITEFKKVIGTVSFTLPPTILLSRKHSIVSCSRCGGGNAKQGRDVPLCRKCQLKLAQQKCRARKREEERKKQPTLESVRIQSLANELMTQDPNIWIGVIQYMKPIFLRKIEEQRNIELDPTYYEDTILETNTITPIQTIPYTAYVLKGLLLVGDEMLAATDKEKQLKQLDPSISSCK